MKNELRKSRARGGYTLIEMMLSLFMFALLMSTLGIVTSTSHNLYRSSSLTTSTDGKARRGLDRAAAELTSIGGSMMTPDPNDNFGRSTIDFRQALGVAGGNPIWGQLMRLGFEYETGEIDDGQDNNGNGLVDEGSVVLIRDLGGLTPRRVVLCNGVRELAEGETVNGVDDNGNGVIDEGGFNLQRVGDVMTIRLWLEAVGADDEVIVRQNQVSVRLRNLGI